MNNLIFSFLASFGFSIIFNIKGKNLLIASLGGVIAWCMYLFSAVIIEDEIIRYFIASVSISLYSQKIAISTGYLLTTNLIVSSKNKI